MQEYAVMNKSTNDYVAIYKAQLEKGDIQVAYERLVKYVMALKVYFSNELSDKYKFGNVSPGYMDYTYFPFFDDYLRSKKLRFGIVLNHQNMRFELWLMGQNTEVQKKYWDLLKATEWNRDRAIMPKYSVLEAVLVEAPNFEDLDALSAEIEKSAICIVEKVMNHIPEY